MLRTVLTTLALAGILLALSACAPATSPSGPAPTNTGTPAWARTVASGTAATAFSATATDRSGNVYAAGAVFGSGLFEFGDGVEVSDGLSGHHNLVLVKYNASGTAQWARTILAEGMDWGGDSHFYAVATDADGNVYAAGDLFDPRPYDFGNGVTVTGPESLSSAVVVKYDASGTAQWARSLVAAAGPSAFNAVTVDNSGDVFAAGFIQGYGTSDDYDFGNDVVATATGSGQRVVLVKFDSEGTAQWARSALLEETGDGESSFNSIAADRSGHVYVTGYLLGNDAFDFGNGAVVQGTTTFFNALLVRYDASGTTQWARTVSSGPSTSYFSGVALAGSGHVYVAGYVNSDHSYDFGNDVSVTGTAVNTYNALLVQYDAAGTAQWARTVESESTGATIFNALAVDGSGNVFTAGGVYDTKTYDFGGGVTTSGSSSLNNPLLVKYDAQGTAQWARTAVSGAGNHSFYSLAAFQADLYVTAILRGTDAAGFGAGVTATGTATDNALLVKFE